MSLCVESGLLSQKVNNCHLHVNAIEVVKAVASDQSDEFLGFSFELGMKSELIEVKDYSF